MIIDFRVKDHFNNINHLMKIIQKKYKINIYNCKIKVIMNNVIFNIKDFNSLNENIY